MTAEAKTIYETLLESGALDTISLRRKARMTNRSSDSRFNTAITALQADFKLLPVGVARAGGWNYAFIYDIVARYYPDLPQQARHITERDARKKLVSRYFRSVGAAQKNDVSKIFGWSRKVTERALLNLVEIGAIQRGFEIRGYSGEWFALPELI